MHVGAGRGDIPSVEERGVAAFDGGICGWKVCVRWFLCWKRVGERDLNLGVSVNFLEMDVM